MAVPDLNAYTPGWLFRSPHINTIYPHLFRKHIKIAYDRRRLQTSDGDFIDLDNRINGSQTAVLMLHGLEGSSSSHYIKGMTRAVEKMNYDVFVMNQRGCSGELNKKYGSYHSGKTDDLNEVIQFITEEYDYKNLILVGFSLGGNICLKYTGEKGQELDRRIKAVVAISVPCDLSESAQYLARSSNFLYMKRFMRMLKSKALKKAVRHPESKLKEAEIKKCADFASFDEIYTAPAHGFDSAEHYWKVNSSKQFIHRIKRNTLLINALDDPFFGNLSHPVNECTNNPMMTFEQPKHGGHVGFAQWNLSKNLWHENRTITFIEQSISQSYG